MGRVWWWWRWWWLVYIHAWMFGGWRCAWHGILTFSTVGVIGMLRSKQVYYVGIPEESARDLFEGTGNCGVFLDIRSWCTHSTSPTEEAPH